jgi:hypothetical protein
MNLLVSGRMSFHPEVLVVGETLLYPLVNQVVRLVGAPLQGLGLSFSLCCRYYHGLRLYQSYLLRSCTTAAAAL